jgi:hypothetical protein
MRYVTDITANRDMPEFQILARNLRIYLCQRYTGKKLKESVLYFGIGEFGVSQACRRLARKIEKDKKLQKRLLYWKIK